MTEEDTKRLVLGFLGSLTAGGVIYLVTRPSSYSISQLVTPEKVAYIAAELPQGDDDFAQAALKWVSDNIQYQALGSDISFKNGSVLCRGCYTPTSVLAKGAGNCVAQSFLLTSILRNRIDADRVYATLGEVTIDGVGGHAWTSYWRDGGWYILDPTYKEAVGKWMPASHPSYLSQVHVNDIMVHCEEGAKVCVKKCPACLRREVAS